MYTYLIQEIVNMNIQENIRRILREEINESLFFRRRVDMDLLNKRAFENLNDATDTFLKRYNQGKKFKFSQFKSVVIDYIMDSYHNELSNGGSKDFPYDEVYEYLSKYYHDKIKDRYELMFGGNINESKEKSTNELITTVLNTLVLPQYEHVICGFELKNIDDESLNNVINYPGVTVTFIGGYGTKMWPQTQAVQKMYDDVLDDIWETVWDYTGISLIQYSKYVKDCGKENIYLREQKEEKNYISIIEKIVEPFKEDDGVCDIDMWYDEEDDMYSVYLVFGTEELNDKFTNDGKYLYIRKKIIAVKETIKSYLPIDNLFVGSYGKPNCGWKTLNESKDKLNEIWHEVPSSEYNSLQDIINLVMKEKYGWWKDIKINTLNYIETYGDVHIEAELTVDEEWGANQWREFYYVSEFPGNKGWEDDGYELVRFGDIIDSWYAEVIRHDLKELLKYTLNIDANDISFRKVYLIFE